MVESPVKMQVAGRGLPTQRASTGLVNRLPVRLLVPRTIRRAPVVASRPALDTKRLDGDVFDFEEKLEEDQLVKE